MSDFIVLPRIQHFIPSREQQNFISETYIKGLNNFGAVLVGYSSMYINSETVCFILNFNVETTPNNVWHLVLETATRIEETFRSTCQVKGNNLIVSILANL